MKTYLNGDERRTATCILMVYGIMGKVIERENIISKEEMKCLKYASTYIIKYMEALRERVGNEEVIRIYDEALHSQLDLKPKGCEGLLVVDKDSLEETCRMAVEKNCFGCSRKNWRNCGLYKCMHKVGMGKVDDDYDGCEFYYEPIEEEIK